jgi:hypothetical protein
MAEPVKKMGSRPWSGRSGLPKPSIPASATERVTKRDEQGRKTVSEFWFRGRKVGRVTWSPDGNDFIAVGLRNGVRVGYQLSYHDYGAIYAEPFVRGVLHGLAMQFSSRGKLLLGSPFKRGTGTDYWCDDDGRLAEEHPLVAGRPSGTERWWCEDQKTVYSETEWLDGEWHGATRYWNNGRLDRGFPKFFVRGNRVSKRAYVQLAKTEPSLPPYCPEADRPARALPKVFLELKQRARRGASLAGDDDL